MQSAKDVMDFTKNQKELYLPKTEPAIVDVPCMTFFAVDGRGDPNEPGGAYPTAVALLYALSYTLKMSELAGHAIDGFFPYRVPPLEGLWRMADGQEGVDYRNKAGFCWTAMIRQPDFADDAVFSWACGEVRRKKKLDTACARRMEFSEGLCVQCVHIGPYDSEPATVEKMGRFLKENGYRADFSETRLHHEIYLSDPRRTAPNACKTVIRHPAARL